MARLRELADEFGYWPATTDEADIERHRRLNAGLDRNYRPHRWDHLGAANKKAEQQDQHCRYDNGKCSTHSRDWPARRAPASPDPW